MSEVVENIPEGFQRADLGEGYGGNFGPMYKNTCDDQTLLGFFVAEHHLNHTGFCHGGALALFADMQLIPVIHQVMSKAKHYPTKNVSIDFFSPIPLGVWVEMQVDLVRETKTALFTHSAICVNGKVVAQSQASYHIT